MSAISSVLQAAPTLGGHPHSPGPDSAHLGYKSRTSVGTADTGPHLCGYRETLRTLEAACERPTKKTAITRAELEAMLATCDDSLEGLRDRALLCFGFASGGRRRSEIAAADLRDLRKVGEDGYIYRLEYSKTQQAGLTADSTPDKPILGRSAEALAAWLEAAGIDEGAIFRRIWKGRVGHALLPGSVAAIVKRRARLAGLEGDFGAHSLRSGFVTEAGKQGVPLPAVMAMTEHRSVASVIGYFQAGAAEDNPAARLLK